MRYLITYFWRGIITHTIVREWQVEEYVKWLKSYKDVTEVRVSIFFEEFDEADVCPPSVK